MTTTALIYVVIWNLSFLPIHGTAWTKYQHRLEFANQKSAQTFVKWAPTENTEFECTNSYTGEHGYCAVSEVKLLGGDK